MNTVAYNLISNLPSIPFNKNPHIKDEMLWKTAAINEYETFAKLAEKFGATLDVVSHHTSKSIKLPVVRYRFPNGSILIVRDNFYNYMVTVVHMYPVEVHPEIVKFDPKDEISDCYCEGFPSRTVLGSFNADPSAFTACLYGTESLELLLEAVKGS